MPTVLAGPSLNGIVPSWVAAALAAGRGTLRIITAHRYPYWAGYTPGNPGYPSIAGLLSDSLDSGVGRHAATGGGDDACRRTVRFG